jgi:ribonuclease HII
MLGQAGASKFAVARRRESARLADMSICGIDEAGRGPWAGPVVAAAVILPRRGRPKGLADSKILTPEAREALAVEIRACAIVAVGAASVDEIDTLNILHASHLAMRRAFDGLSPAPVAALVDGHIGPDLPCPVEFIVDGDAIAPVISAASIIAKVERDRMMTELCALYPGYGFSKHKGYGTPEHREALLRLGPCIIHRRSFKRVREALASPREASASEFDEAAPLSP